MEVLGIAKNNDNMLINDQIKAREVLVIGPNGEQVGVKQLQDALTLASYAALDLVLISPNGNPPVAINLVLYSTIKFIISKYITFINYYIIILFA